MIFVAFFPGCSNTPFLTCKIVSLYKNEYGCSKLFRVLAPFFKYLKLESLKYKYITYLIFGAIRSSYSLKIYKKSIGIKRVLKNVQDSTFI